MHLLSSPCLCPPQATYVLLALAWVFVPIYISSEVSPLAALRTGLFVRPRCLPTHADRCPRTSAWGALSARFCSPACCIRARKLCLLECTGNTVPDCPLPQPQLGGHCPSPSVTAALPTC